MKYIPNIYKIIDLGSNMDKAEQSLYCLQNLKKWVFLKKWFVLA